MSEQATLHPAFTPHLLNAQGLDKSQRLRAAFSALLCEVEALLSGGRELAIVRTKLEEACMFAVRGVAVAAENQATVQPGEVESSNAIIDRYDAELTGVRVALTKAGVPEDADGKRLTQAERIIRLLPPSPMPQFASVEEVAHRLYQVYAQDANWKDYRGEPLPTFAEMRKGTKAHWLRMAEDLAIYGTTADNNNRRIAETGRPVASL